MIAADYAKALYQLGEKADMKNLRTMLARRGHDKLLPQIYAEYEKLSVAAKRLEMHKAITPEKERTRILVDLYKKLINAH
jgi:F0F1-type ATP synthase delta subunit